MVALAGCAARTSSSAPTAETPLAPPQLRALYTTAHREDGVVLEGDHSGKHWTKWIAPDGTLRLSAAHGMFRDTGRLRVEGDQVCSTWEHIDKGRTACMRVAPAGKDTYVALDPDGTPASQFNVTTPGKPPEPME